MANLIEVRGVSKSYGGIHALQRVTSTSTPARSTA